MTFVFRMECSDGNDNTVYDLLVTADTKEAAILAARKSIESQATAENPGEWLGQDPDGFQIDFDESGDNYNIYTLHEDDCATFPNRGAAMCEHAKTSPFHSLWFA